MTSEMFHFSLVILGMFIAGMRITDFYLERKKIKTLVESAKTSNQRLEDVENEIRKLKS